MNFTDAIRSDLSMRFDDPTAEYLIATSIRIASTAILDDDSNALDPSDPLEFELIDDMIQQLIEPACTFSPLPESLADTPDLDILLMIDAILRMIITHFIFDPDDLHSAECMTETNAF